MAINTPRIYTYRRELVTYMSGPEIDKRYEGAVDDFSNSGNPVVNPGMGAKRTVVLAPDEHNIDVGDRIEFIIRYEYESYYEAELQRHRSVRSGYSSPPNIPIHHDGQSVGSTRSEREASKSLEDREFDPETRDE